VSHSRLNTPHILQVEKVGVVVVERWGGLCWVPLGTSPTKRHSQLNPTCSYSSLYYPMNASCPYRPNGSLPTHVVDGALLKPALLGRTPAPTLALMPPQCS
jgi:hypothetical protein